MIHSIVNLVLAGTMMLLAVNSYNHHRKAVATERQIVEILLKQQEEIQQSEIAIRQLQVRITNHEQRLRAAEGPKMFVGD